VFARRQLALNAITAWPRLLSFRHPVKWSNSGRCNAGHWTIGKIFRSRHGCPFVWPGCAVKPHGRVSGAPEAQGLTAPARPERQFRPAEMMSKSSRTVSPIAGHSVDLPEVTAFSSRFDAGDRRRIGEVGAGRSHPRSRRRTEKPRALSG
jgi:hypothetical protein